MKLLPLQLPYRRLQDVTCSSLHLIEPWQVSTLLKWLGAAHWWSATHAKTLLYKKPKLLSTRVEYYRLLL